ncbi:pseudouridine synthase [Sphingomonas oryzagri]|uniref:Pseudouridine synthase n=1 Tax=Sphingomonas oryzagri TaxID=3042314 RepID=A0ABT6MYU1_9SPHN|nr:pseudouridine synthase [Sphingomonas oryzagri]MDH7637961.1 pseudouridine synthase [Sphingomonas oryzagri]
MSAPRRPGDDGRPGAKKKGWAKAKPKAKRPGRPRVRREPREAAEAGAEPAVKQVRVRKDGSVASGRQDVRTARARAAAAETVPAPANKRARPPRREEASPVKPARTDRPRPARDTAPRPKKDAPAQSDAAPRRTERPAARVRKDGSVAAGNRAAREAHHASREPQRIAKLLARAGVASRREIERMIAEGRIALNGTVIDTPATILTSLAGVTVDGQPVAATEASRLFLFHKPTGLITAAFDPAGRATIYDRLPPGLPRVIPVGRLDLNTEGLLLLTNDGELKRKLELPSTGIPRMYRARAYGEVTQEMLESLSDGVEIDGIRYGPIDANLERRTGRNVWIEIRITEGKNREVRRVLEYLGLQVSRLIRTAYGEFVLADLPVGQVVEVRQHDLEEFRKTIR